MIYALISLSLALNIFLLFAHFNHVWRVDRFNQMQMDINEANEKAMEMITKILK